MAHTYSWITADAITTDLEYGDKEEVIGQMVELLRLTGKVTDADTVEQDILKREAAATTEIDTNLDVPHAITKGVSEFCVSLGVAAHQTVCMLIAWNESNERNLRRLAALIEVVKNEKARILAAESREAIVHIIENGLVSVGLE